MTHGTAILHVYQQTVEHDDLIIIGNSASLIQLRDAIESALASGTGTFAAEQNDGEWFECAIVRENDAGLLQTLPAAYTAAMKTQQNNTFPEWARAATEKALSVEPAGVKTMYSFADRDSI